MNTESTAYTERVAALEAEGMTTSDAQAAVDAELADVTCSNVFCDRTDFLTEYEFADGERARYCMQHSAVAVMNGGRAVVADQIIETEVNLTAYGELLDVMRAARAFVSLSPSHPNSDTLRRRLADAVHVWDQREAGDSVPGSGTTEVILKDRR
jgi:hypothetical protein